ncbi:MAG TPA: methyltransferase domain-containing protein [Candidatus Baltobacteraceae bacterium]|nr:methyltransferase domain-containing protein [Candidatus Baltobacteraceae bacterium]
MSLTAEPRIDEAELHAFVGRMLGDLGAAMSAALVVIGDKLGLYKALNERGPMTSQALAEATGTHERYVREWLANQAASGYVRYDPLEKTFTLPAEHAAVLADESSPLFMHGAFQIIEAAMADEPHITQAFKTGAGFGWHEHDVRLFEGTERFFRPGYNAHLLTDWIPACEGLEAKLRAGAKVADIGCGLGASTILMAKAYPKSTFYGFDYHPLSIETAKERARAAGVADRITFQTATAKDIPGEDYDFIACFDCLHDMGDPVGVAAEIRKHIAADGTWMIVEPFANDRLEENLNPIGRIFYAASTLLCVPSSLAQEVGAGLGAQAGEARVRAVMQEAGFTRFRRATETPFNIVYEARP